MKDRTIEWDSNPLCEYVNGHGYPRFFTDLSVSGLIFEEWDPPDSARGPDTDDSQDPVTMIVNSSQLCAADFDLREVFRLSSHL